MKKCKFCNFINGEDFYADHEIIEKEFQIKTAFNFEHKSKDIEVSGIMPVEKDVYLAVYIDQENNLCAYLDHEIGEKDEGICGKVKMFKRKIKFCPMCGRKLSK